MKVVDLVKIITLLVIVSFSAKATANLIHIEFEASFDTRYDWWQALESITGDFTYDENSLELTEINITIGNVVRTLSDTFMEQNSSGTFTYLIIGSIEKM